MRHKVRKFRSLKIGLKELQPFVINGEHLQTGKSFRSMSDMRSREALANWLLCAATNSWAGEDRLTFTSDPTGGDGIIVDRVTDESWPTEHILVPRISEGKNADIENLILAAIAKKIAKGGAAYASGKTLVVFLNAVGGPWKPNDVAARLPPDCAFEAVWVVGLQRVEEDGAYSYAVTRLDLTHGNAPTWGVKIAPNFETWEVTGIQ